MEGRETKRNYIEVEYRKEETKIEYRCCVEIFVSVIQLLGKRCDAEHESKRNDRDNKNEASVSTLRHNNSLQHPLVCSEANTLQTSLLPRYLTEDHK